MCSSILAGRGSDSDDYGDIAFWVGKEGGAGGKEGILNALGLLGMVERGKIVSIPHEDGPLPAALAQIPPPELMSSDGISELSDLLSRLHDTFEFRVELPGSEGTVVHFLVGKAEDDGYCGLAGVGVWAGE
ncbi:hypothetical protein BOTBODRAFT_69694 [Botryobasidium botryosum FD-172 SS1]|uniref:Uncharacterized protein n=1 Tax=Botryobasidium botryosum (strain FD-172 SS1) TaxID=930990 RepID=A0A067LZ10_BOTB1|nr:hypothetical protein BOTBODRAFT_69694 [Botryobasidium botryosum FD-172 SS1]